jgi:hypothetical protein
LRGGRYSWRLATVADENEFQSDRACSLAGARADMDNLYHEVFVMLLSTTK